MSSHHFVCEDVVEDTVEISWNASAQLATAFPADIGVCQAPSEDQGLQR